VAVSGHQVFLFDGPVAVGPPFATLRRDEVRVVYGGSAMWRRPDLITGGEAGQRAYTIMVCGRASFMVPYSNPPALEL
jgi:hypothetical protein